MAVVTLKLTLGNFSVEVSGPEEYAEKKLEELVGRYLTTSTRPVQPESPATAPGQPAGKKLSPAEFLKQVIHHNSQDRALALGFFLEKYEGVSNFTTSELGEMGKITKYPFSNVSDSVARLVARGLMMSAGEKDGARAYALTATGEEIIESMIQSPKA